MRLAPKENHRELLERCAADEEDNTPPGAPQRQQPAPLSRATTRNEGTEWKPKDRNKQRGSKAEAEENGVSRIYNGFHFRNAVNTGIKHGRKIADRAINHFLKPVH